jgi:hypothetical protein
MLRTSWCNGSFDPKPLRPRLTESSVNVSPFLTSLLQPQNTNMQYADGSPSWGPFRDAR